MDGIKGKHQGQLEITDLIDEAVNHAAARRNQTTDLEETLSDEQMANVKGGVTSPTVLGVIVKPPIVLGIIIKPPVA